MNRTSRSLHTPGPWAVTVLPTTILIESAHGCVCELASHWGQKPKRRVANAKLIAAAPDLLKAAQNVIESWSSGDLAAAVRWLNAAVDLATDGAS
jgi:hypothetical protein